MQKKSVFRYEMKRAVMTVLLMMVMIAATACDKQEPEYNVGVEPVMGGSQTEKQVINVSDIDINYFDGKSEIAIHFVYGGNEETQNESAMVALPQYEVYLLEEPYRLAVQLYAVDSVRYVEKSTWGLGEQVVGLLRARVKGSDITTIYFELNGPAQFLVDEGDNTLRVLVERDKEEKNENHFVMVNAFDEYLDGALGEDLGLLPVLCDDKVNIGMITEPFASEDAAENARGMLATQLATLGVDKTPYTLTLAGGVQPIYNSDIDSFEPERQVTAFLDGKAQTLSLLLEESRKIAENDSADIYVKYPYSNDGAYLLDGENIWMVVKQNGKLTDLGLPAFASVQQASFSSSGRYLGFIDVSVDTRVLYVYDFLSGRLFNLGEEDFGVNTASFAWAEDEEALYAVTGDEGMRIAKCAFTDTSLILSVVVRMISGEGKIADMDDQVIVADNTAGEHGIIYAFDKKSGERTFLCEGVDFEIAPDNEAMAVVEFLDFGEEVGYGNLKVYSFLDKSETMVAAGSTINAFAFLPSSTALIFTDGSLSDTTYRFNHALCTYDMGTSTKTILGYLKSGSFMLSKDAKTLAVVHDYLGTDGRYRYTTYELEWRDYQPQG